MKFFSSVAVLVAKQKHQGHRLLASISKPIYVAFVLILSFGVSVVGHAAQKVKKRVRRTNMALKSSYAGYMMSKAWSYFRPVWNSPGLETLASPNDELSKVLDDPDNRIEKAFRVPSPLKGRVRFWVDVYARYNSQYRIVHDRENPERIYGVIDMRPLFRAFPSRVAHAKAYQIEKMILKSLKARLAEAVDLNRPKKPTVRAEEKAEIRKMLAKFGATDASKAATYIARVRTQTGQADHFMAAIGRSRKLLPQIEKIFKAKGLPTALTRLPFVETSFNPKAVSKSGAIGMWQFMPDTSRQFDPRGSRKDWADPMRQSRNAARMLTLLYKKLGDWGIAVTGYNSGGARLARIASKYRVDNIVELLEIPASKDTLGFAGRNFFAELLAANLVVAYKEKAFSPRAMQISRLGVSRRVQSLLETISSTVVPAPETESKEIARDPASSQEVAKIKADTRSRSSKSQVRHRHGKSRLAAKNPSSKRLAVRDKRQAHSKVRRGNRAGSRSA